MSSFLFQCPTHGDDWTTVDCEDCIRIRAQLKKNEEVAKRTKEALGSRPRLREEVYWPSNNSHEGRLIENLSHRPIHFSEKRKFRDYLRRKNIREAC